MSAGKLIFLLGSEDKHVYIYDTQTAEIVSKIKVPQHIVHLVNPRHPSNSVEFVSSYVECSRIDFWTPQLLSEREGIIKEKEKKNRKEKKNKKE